MKKILNSENMHRLHEKKKIARKKMKKIHKVVYYERNESENCMYCIYNNIIKYYNRSCVIEYFKGYEEEEYIKLSFKESTGILGGSCVSLLIERSFGARFMGFFP